MTYGDIVIVGAVIDASVDEHQIRLVLDGILQQPLNLSDFITSNCLDTLSEAFRD